MVEPERQHDLGWAETVPFDGQEGSWQKAQTKK